jgi:hypothetical protein
MGRLLDQGDQIMRFDVIGSTVKDPSRIPDFMRELPEIDMSLSNVGGSSCSTTTTDCGL